MSDDDVFLVAGIGMKAFPWPWLAVSAFLPYRWSVGRDDRTDRDVDLHGLGDVPLAAELDVLEIFRPTLVRVPCPETGGPILARKDADDFVKAPHLTLSAGVWAPVGRDDHVTHEWVYPPQYQPGGGVWVPSAGLSYAQGLGRFTPAIGVTYLFSTGANSVDYEMSDALLGVFGVDWLAWPERLGTLHLAVSVLSPMAESTNGGEALDGSDERIVLLDVGGVVWVGSFWRRTRKIMAGLMGTVPLVEGTRDTEPRNGIGASVFCTFGF